MFEIDEYEKVINKMIRIGDFKSVFCLSKSLYDYEFVSEKIRMIYGQCLVLMGNNYLASEVFEKLYNEGYHNYYVLSNLLFICFESYDFEGASIYLNELKRFCNRRQLSYLIPFEIYLYKVLGYDTSSICLTKSALYLKNQISCFDRKKAINFIRFKNNYGDFSFDNDCNIEGLFYMALDYVCANDRGLQFNPFGNDICFFDKYYMDFDSFSLVRSPYVYVEISTLPFSNHICMIRPSFKDGTIKKLSI